MPYGPGRLEGEGFDTFLLDEWANESGQDDETGFDDGGPRYLRFNGPFQAELQARIEEGTEAGYTIEEIEEGIDTLLDAAGAIVTYSEQGFVTSDLYGTADELEAGWQEITDSIPPDADTVSEGYGLERRGDGIEISYPYKSGVKVEYFDDEDSAARFVIDRMESEGFYPNTYSTNDHGNLTEYWPEIIEGKGVFKVTRDWV